MSTDDLPFEPVSFDEARNALDRAVAEPGSSRADPAKQRTAALPGELALSGRAQQWLADLPGDVRPVALPGVHARIANRIAEVWPDPARCVDYLDSLVFSDRPERRGFAEEVGREIAVLRAHRMASAGVRPAGQFADGWSAVEGFERLDRRGSSGGA